MNTNDDIRRLIRRFMAGETSVDEENRIAGYFRTHDVDDDLRPYKEMFAWFDEGMPCGYAGDSRQPETTQASGGTAHMRRRNKRPLAAWLTAAAAAVAAVLTAVVWPQPDPTETAGTHPIAEASAPQPSPAVADTLTSDTAGTATQRPRIKRNRPRRDKYKPMPPKTFIAQQASDSAKAAGERLAEEYLEQYRQRQEEMLEKISRDFEDMERGLDIYMTASTEYSDEETLY